jgi:cell division protease FtsH
VRALIEQAHNEAYEVISANRDILDKLALALLEEETLDHNQIAEIFTEIKKLPERPLWLSSEGRPVSERPPIEVPKKDVSLAASVEAPAAAPRSQQESAGASKPRPATA